MLDDFKAILKQLEGTVGKYKTIIGRSEEVSVRHSSGLYTDSKVIVTFDDKQILLHQGFDKYGYEFINIHSFPLDYQIEDYPESSDDKFESLFLSAMEEYDVNIEELAYELFYLTHMAVNIVIDLENITDADIEYMEEKLQKLKSIKGD